jgi:cytochrome c oxidase subunit 2
MLLRVVVQPRADFERWLAAQRLPAETSADALVTKGRALFEQTACINCHRVRGTDAEGRFGPDLTHLMSRATLGSGVVTNDRAHLIEWITSPDHFKPGVLMPAMQLNNEQIAALANYLESLR